MLDKQSPLCPEHLTVLLHDIDICWTPRAAVVRGLIHDDLASLSSIPMKLSHS